MTQPFLKKENSGFINIKIPCVKPLLRPKNIFSNQFLVDLNVGNGQKTWQTIANAFNRKPPKSTSYTISIDSKLCTNKKDIANEFNNYFATICANNQIPDINTHYTSYLNTPIESTFNFEHIDNATTMHHLSKLTLSHSCGHDNLSIILEEYCK